MNVKIDCIQFSEISFFLCQSYLSHLAFAIEAFFGVGCGGFLFFGVFEGVVVCVFVFWFGFWGVLGGFHWVFFCLVGCFLGFFNIIIIFFLFLKTKPQTAMILSGSKASLAPFVQTHPLLPSRTSALRNEAVALFQPNNNKSHLAACNSFPTQCKVLGLLLKCELRTKLFTFISTLPPVQAWDSLEKSDCYERGGRVPWRTKPLEKTGITLMLILEVACWLFFCADGGSN